MTGSDGRDDSRGTHVGLADVQRLEDTIARLRAQDYRYGGGACGEAVAEVLPHAVGLLGGTVRGKVRPRLCTAVADLYNLAGWTSFDDDRPEAALEAFAQALHLAVEAGNHDLQANIRYRAGRLLLHYDAVDPALTEFARGREAALRAHSPLAQAILSANQAWAHAKKADVVAALACLHRARTEFAAAAGAEPPPWAAFGATDLAAMIGTVHGELAQVVDVRHGRDGIPALVDAIAGYGPEMARSRSLTMIWLATVHALDGDLDVAAEAGREAIELAGGLRSPRTRQRLRTLSIAARRHRRDARAQEIIERIEMVGHSGQ
jgi:tetratricopeptide (TPR) repeat protein